jgi:Glycosyl transferases group 1
MSSKTKRILFLTFYYEPDLCAGSFRATALVEALKASKLENVEIDVLTTMPNRYNTFKIDAQEFEDNYPVKIYRIPLSNHKSGFIDQATAFSKFYFRGIRLARQNKYDLIVATSSRLFTAFMAASINMQQSAYLYLDIRDIFTDTMSDVLKNPLLRFFTKPLFSMIEWFTFSRANHINLVSEGFRRYFEKKYQKSYSYFTNGIDQAFLEYNFQKTINTDKKIITYAGNIGEGQGLHHIVPLAAKILEDKFHFNIIGDGGTKANLVKSIEVNEVKNVSLLEPVNREKLLEYYKQSDYLMLHLNDYQAFEKVLPSKIFEYGATHKGIIAGVKGYAADFLAENLPDAVIFQPKDVNTFTEQLLKIDLLSLDFDRSEFIQKFNRKHIMAEMSKHILEKLYGK